MAVSLARKEKVVKKLLSAKLVTIAAVALFGLSDVSVAAAASGTPTDDPPKPWVATVMPGSGATRAGTVTIPLRLAELQG